MREIILKKVGEKVPEIFGIDHEGKTVTGSQFSGKKVILFFYPQDDTPTCTKEACNLRDNYSVLKTKSLELVGVSPDNEKKHQKFINKYSLPYTLICDVDKKLMLEFGVWGPKKFMGKEFDGVHRTTFIISEKGIVEFVIDKVDSANHAQQILNILEN